MVMQRYKMLFASTKLRPSFGWAMTISNSTPIALKSNVW
jgi:hypothetical protein